MAAVAAAVASVSAQPAQADDPAPILGTWKFGSDRLIKITSAGGGSYTGMYLNGVNDCGTSVSGLVAWRLTGSGKSYTGSSEWIQTSPQCLPIGPGEATWTLDSDTTGTYCATSPNREVVDSCGPMTKVEAAPAGPAPSGGDWWKWLLALLAALAAATAAFYKRKWFTTTWWWSRNHGRARDALGQTAQTALDHSGPVQTAASLPGAAVGTQVAGKAAGMLDTAKRMGDITAGTPKVFELYGQSGLSSAGSEYLLSGDQARFELVDRIESSGDEGAIVKAANLLKAKGAAAVTEADLRTIITEFGL